MNEGALKGRRAAGEPDLEPGVRRSGTHLPRGEAGGFIAAAWRVIARLERVSYDTLVSTPARIFIAGTFFMSGRTKVDGLLDVNQSAFYLFANEYALPLIPSRLAAYLAAYAEHLLPILLILGLGTRLSATALLVMTAVIQFFVYPDAWSTHLLWASMLVFLMFRGPGRLSVDYYLRRTFAPRGTFPPAG